MALFTSTFPKTRSCALGRRCKLGFTNHPQAEKYRGQSCEIVDVHTMLSGEPMVTVLFADGAWISGLFFCELEDERGEQLRRMDFSF